MEQIKVLVVDDHIIFKEGILSMLSHAPNIEVVSEAKNGREAVNKAMETMPDVVLMDLKMPDFDGISATKQIVEQSPHIKVLILTASEDGKDLIHAIKAGASGYVLKDVDKEELIQTIEATYRGESVINPALAAELLDEFVNMNRNLEKEPHPLVHALTDREIDVLRIISEGLENKEIAKKLFISESTVKNHVSNILTKLQLKNRIEAAVFAEREGIAR